MRSPRVSVLSAAIVMSWGAVATGHAQLPAKPPELQSLGLWSYDAQARLYRAWLFLPGANVVGFGNGITRTTTHRFPDRDTCEWAITAKDRGGKVYLDISGT